MCVKTLKPLLGKCYVETSFGKCYVFSPHTSLSSNFVCMCPSHPYTPRHCVCVHFTHTHPDTVHVSISPIHTQTLCMCPLHPYTPRYCACVHFTHTHPDTVHVSISPIHTQTLCMCPLHPHTPRHYACVHFTHTHPDTLTQKKREESESALFTKMPSPHYMEVATLILNTSVHSLHTH